MVNGRHVVKNLILKGCFEKDILSAPEAVKSPAIGAPFGRNRYLVWTLS